MQIFAPRVTRDEPSQALLLAAHERMLLYVGLPDCDATPPTHPTPSAPSTPSTPTYTSDELLALADSLAHALTLLERRRAAIAASIRAWGAAPKPRPGQGSNSSLNLNSKSDLVLGTPAGGAEGKEEAAAAGARGMRSSRAAGATFKEDGGWGADSKPEPHPASGSNSAFEEQGGRAVWEVERKEEEGPRGRRGSRAAVRPGARRRRELRQVLEQTGRLNEVREAVRFVTLIGECGSCGGGSYTVGSSRQGG